MNTEDEHDQRQQQRPLAPHGLHNLADLLCNIEEIADNVLCRLPPSDLRTLLLSCRALGRHAARFLWSDMAFSNFHGYLGLSEIIKILRNPRRTFPYEQYVISLTISYHTSLSSSFRDDIRLDELFKEMTTRCQKIQSVSIDVGNQDKLRWSTIVSALMVMDHLHSVQLVSRKSRHGRFLGRGMNSVPPQGGVVNDATLVTIAARQASQIQSIRIAGDEFSDQGVLEIASLCKQLRSFAALHCPDVTTTSLIHLTRQCRQLKSLSIHNCALTYETFTRVINTSSYSNLRHLHLDLTHYNQRGGLASVLGNCRSLSEISLAHAHGTQLEELAEHGPSLEGVRLQFPQMTEDAAMAFGRSFPTLKVLWISGGRHVQDIHLIYMRSCFQHLESLTLDNLDHVTDAGIRAIAEYMPNIRWITLQGLQLTDMSANIICSSCTHTEQLWIKSQHFSKEIYWQCLVQLPYLSWARVENVAFGTKDEFTSFRRRHPRVAMALKNGLHLEAVLPRKTGFDFDWCWNDGSMTPPAF